jgi:ATP-dependent Lhr-like helicase
MALQARMRANQQADVTTVWSDDGIVVRLSDREGPPDGPSLVPDPDEIERLVVRELGGTALFAGRFREAAGRALLLPRRRPGQRSPLWMQRKRSADLLNVAARYGSFPIILETFRECLQDVFDVPALIELVRKIERREIRVVTVDSDGPSPFSAALLFNYAANYIYDGDAPLAERRAQALTIDFTQLRELLGEAQLRELLDAEAVAETELGLQSLLGSRRARSVDGVHDLLLRLGDLSRPELLARVEPGPEYSERLDSWLHQLSSERRVISVTIGGDDRFIAAEDAGRYRDALGVALPLGLPDAFLTPSEDPLGDLIARYARTHGPFQPADVARRFGMGEAAVGMSLTALRDAGRLLDGEFRPGHSGQEWCDAEVLNLLRRRSLARLRKQIEPASPAAYARLILDWQGVRSGGSSPVGVDGLLDVVEQLQGALLPASILESEILPARLPRYQRRDLDELCAAGEVIWIGRGALGERDGRVSLYLPARLSLLGPAECEPLEGDQFDRVRKFLAQYGASFYHDMAEALDGFVGRELLDSLWALVWNGEIVNDSPAALRAYLGPQRPQTGRRNRGPLAFRSRRLAPPSSVGRWSLLKSGGRAAIQATATERLAGTVEQMLDRYGVLTRSVVVAEGTPGGFTAIYPVLRAMEEAGKLRRGYFIDGLGGSQFAHPPALDRLRSLRDEAIESGAEPSVVLTAADPANPYGSVLPWPASPESHSPFSRSAGAYVVLFDGELAAYIGRGEHAIVTLLPDYEPRRSNAARATAAGLAAWALARGNYQPDWRTVDGLPIMQSVLSGWLREAGFVPSGPGLRLTTQPRGAAVAEHA